MGSHTLAAGWLLLVATALPPHALALQAEAPRYQELAYAYDSGPVSNPGLASAIVLSVEVRIEDAGWLRLFFKDVQLAGNPFEGNASILRLTSLEDGAVQELNALHVAQWRSSSCYLNGESVLVEVVAQPGTGVNRIALGTVWAGQPPITDSQCGPTDDRVLSSDPRAGRLLPVGCTGWIIDDCNSCMLTAGHCSGGLGVLQFNVPMSLPNGTKVNPPPEDQYAIDSASLQTNGGPGVGDDWAYFGCFPNSNTGMTPFQRQGARYSLRLPPPFNGSQSIRITGYGTDSTPSPTYNQVQQTHVGPWRTLNGSTVQYETDTTGGNSGSPVIHEQSGHAIGIHTHGGCSTSSPFGQNSGTASSHAELQAALAAPIGLCGSATIVLPNGAPSVLAAGVPTPVDVQVNGAIVPGTAFLQFRYQGGAFQGVPLNALGGGLYRGTLPAAACTDSPEFYVEAQTSTCTLTSPPGAPGSFYSAVVGTLVTSFSDNFETNQGWTASNLGATSGDWQRGVPVNDPNWNYDPVSDSDGSGQCWLTQNAFGNTDVDNGSVRLASPVIDMSGPGSVLSYDYYLHLTVANGADRLLLEASNDGGNFWAPVATHTTHGGLAWRNQRLTAAEFAAAGVPVNSAMRLRFTINDGGTQSIVEGGIDAVKVSSLTCGLGVNYCSSGPLGSVVSATGSVSVAANDLVLHADQVPTNKVGIFIYSANQQSIPFGNATLCVGGGAAVVRLPAVNSGAGTTLDFAMDYGALPPSGQVVPGSVYNFQAWFRTGGSQFDLSNGLQLGFVP